MRAFIAGFAGTALSDAERSFLRETEPWGGIVFARNIADPRTLRRLIDDIRTVLGRAVPMLVDQEGGRVQRLGPPHWPQYPPAAAYGRLYARDRARGRVAAQLGGRLIAADLAEVGLDVDCMPIADVPVPGADTVIGDRAFAGEPEAVAALAGAFAQGLAEGGVLPVLKHIPGHGRARGDSHYKLPVVNAERAVLEATDFAAFRPLARLPLAMTAHVVFSAIDPIAPATISAAIVREVIRGSIGFGGLLMSDDLSMDALSGSLGDRTRAALAAGCDLVLHCNGNIEEMLAVAAAAPLLSGDRAQRAAAALERKKLAVPIDLATKRTEFFTVMSSVWEPARGSA
jgi:beta-N-acetylhexosaminidase